jgi:hypothetical protein
VDAIYVLPNTDITESGFLECVAQCEDRAIEQYVAVHTAASSTAAIGGSSVVAPAPAAPRGVSSDAVTKMKHLVCVHFDLLDTERKGVSSASALAFTIGRVEEVAALFGVWGIVAVLWFAVCELCVFCCGTQCVLESAAKQSFLQRVIRADSCSFPCVARMHSVL